jgi:uncharacterized protein (UPF0548 family)
MKLFLRKPADTMLSGFIEEFKNDEYTHGDVGATMRWQQAQFDANPDSKLVSGKLVVRRRERIGVGQQDYMLAIQAIQKAICFDLGWVECYRKRDFEVDDVFALTTRAFGIWTSCFCRVVYSKSEDISRGKMFSLGLGTLPCHAAKGEERFSIVWEQETDEVSLLLGSFSRPQTWLAKLFAFYLRSQQRRFGTEAIERVRQEVKSASGR